MSDTLPTTDATAPQAEAGALPPRPRVTLFVPTYNESAAIAPCLDSLLAQDYPGELTEVLVVDGQSSDDTVAVVQHYVQDRRDTLAAMGLAIRIVDNPEQSLSAAWNVAAREATGDIICLVGAHSSIGPHHVSLAVRHLQEGAAQVVGGPYEMVGLGSWGEAIARTMSCPFGVGQSGYRYGSDNLNAASVGNACYPLALLRRFLPFDTAIGKGEDWELHYRMRQAGVGIAQYGDMRFRFEARTTLRTFWRQQWSYAQAKVNIIRKHGLGAVRATHFIPLALVLYTILGGAAAVVWAPARLPWLCGLGLYVAFSSVTSVRLAARHGWRLLGRAIVAFACMHFAYGLGMLRQLLFGPRRRRSQPQPVP
ncbi:MAG: glycosyltransferase [Armatimonadetes bacterium]|nr:glycosyltransferase [Armatimonadota bacterium]